jgi:hypothetical protein
VYAHTVFVEGSMDGDLFGSEQVIVRKSAKVRGNITSPRVTLEDGAAFKGSIEMDPESVKSVLGSVAGANRGPAPARPAAMPQAVTGSAPISNVGGQSLTRDRGDIPNRAVSCQRRNRCPSTHRCSAVWWSR